MTTTNKNGYKVDFINKVIIVTKDFHRRASNTNSTECTNFKTLVKELPDFKVCFPTPRRRKPANGRLTYDKMIDYICRQEDAESALSDFNAVRNPENALPTPYPHVKKWFLARFPNYGKMPAFKQSVFRVVV